MEQPLYYTNSQFPHHVCKLNRALYGLKQVPWAWFHRFRSLILRIRFKCSKADSSLFVYHSQANVIYLLLYVADIVLTGNNSQLFCSFITWLATKFSMTDLGDLHYFHGIEVSRTSYGPFLSQTKYALDLLEHA